MKPQIICQNEGNMNTVKQQDLGTLESRSEDIVSVEIDGKPVSVKTGTSVMRAARESVLMFPSYVQLIH